MTFHNRESELKRLNESFSRNEKQLVIVFGRRRLGKTTLLRKFSQTHDAFFFSCPISTAGEALKQFQKQMAEKFDEPILRKATFSGWQEALEYIFEMAIQRNTPLIFDEFPYLLKSVPGIDSLLQHLWDKTDKKIWIALCGSLVSVMRDQVLAQEAPLYGRRSEVIQIRSFSFHDTGLFYPDATFVEKAYWYGFFGGIPAYAEKASSYKSPLEAIEKMILDQNGVLYQEPEFLVREELREPGAYFSILHSLASGKTRPNEIAQDSGVPHSGINKYLDTLKRMQLVERRVPLTEKNPERSTKALYRMADNFLQFWFRFVFPNRSIIELGRGSILLNGLIKPDLNTFMGPVYELICHQELNRNSRKLLGWEAVKIGRYWDHKTEVDIVVENGFSRRVAFLECKWGKQINVTKTLNTLKSKSDLIPQYAGWEKQWHVMSRTKGSSPNHIFLG